MTPTDRDWKRLGDYISAVQAMLRLTHWRIELRRENSSDGTNAEIFFTDGKQVASVRVSPEFWTRGASEKREIVTHELLHVHTRPIDCLFRVASRELAPTAQSMLATEADEREELLVDALTAAVAPLMPKWKGR